MRRLKWFTARGMRRGVVVALLTGATVPIAAAVTIMAAFIFLPLPATLPNAKNTVASQISHVYDADGKEIAVFREFEQNIPVKPADIPDVMRQALIAAEDRQFYSHGGIDLRGTARALWADLRNRGAVQGGSTITQQYVKNAYVGKERTIIRKVREAILASQISPQVRQGRDPLPLSLQRVPGRRRLRRRRRLGDLFPQARQSDDPV